MRRRAVRYYDNTVSTDVEDNVTNSALDTRFVLWPEFEYRVASQIEKYLKYVKEWFEDVLLYSMSVGVIKATF